MSSVDRQQLIDVLEVLKKHHPKEKPAVPPPVVEEQCDAKDVGSREMASAPIHRTVDRGAGDVNALAARLLEEEKSKQKPPLTKSGMYKWVGGFTLVVIALIVIFS